MFNAKQILKLDSPKVSIHDPDLRDQQRASEVKRNCEKLSANSLNLDPVRSMCDFPGMAESCEEVLEERRRQRARAERERRRLREERRMRAAAEAVAKSVGGGAGSEAVRRLAAEEGVTGRRRQDAETLLARLRPEELMEYL